MYACVVAAANIHFGVVPWPAALLQVDVGVCAGEPEMSSGFVGWLGMRIKKKIFRIKKKFI